MYVHKPTGRQFKTQEELLVAEKAWNKRLMATKWKTQPIKQTPWEDYWSRLQKEREREAAMRLAKVDALKELIRPLEEERERWVEEREEAVAFQIKETKQQLDDALLQIQKLKTQVNILRSAINNFEKEGRKEWEAKNPFPKEKELKALRNKLYKT